MSLRPARIVDAHVHLWDPAQTDWYPYLSGRFLKHLCQEYAVIIEGIAACLQGSEDWVIYIPPQPDVGKLWIEEKRCQCWCNFFHSNPSK